MLRYWEREFSQLRPQKNRAGNRVYADKDLEVLRVIKRLLREERYTVAGAKEHLRSHGVQKEIERERITTPASESSPKTLSMSDKANEAMSISRELKEIAEDIRSRVAS